jgi:hypothetical protein
VTGSSGKQLLWLRSPNNFILCLVTTIITIYITIAIASVITAAPAKGSDHCHDPHRRPAAVIVGVIPTGSSTCGLGFAMAAPPSATAFALFGLGE